MDFFLKFKKVFNFLKWGWVVGEGGSFWENR
jgi:hypothetical protein